MVEEVLPWSCPNTLRKWFWEEAEHFVRSPTSNPSAQPVWEPSRSVTESAQRGVLSTFTSVLFFLPSEGKGSTSIVSCEV